MRPSSDHHRRPARALRAAAILLALVSPAVASETQDPMLTAGFAPETVHEGDMTGSVNVLNGSLTVSIPIGPAYPVNEALSYRLALSYSSNLRTWYSDQAVPGSAYLRGRSPIGWGWVMHFGRVASDPFDDGLFAYQSPDGVWHPLFPESDPAVCTNDRWPPGSCFVARDSTFIRAIKKNDSAWYVWTPDGIERILTHYVPKTWACGETLGTPEYEPPGICQKRPDFEGWYTTQIRDPEGADQGGAVNIVYWWNRPHCMRTVWDSVRGLGSPTIEFQCEDGPGTRDDGGVYTRIDVRNAMGAISYYFPTGQWSRPYAASCPMPAAGNEFLGGGRDVFRLTGLAGPEGMTAFGYHRVGVLNSVDYPGDLARASYDWNCVPYSRARTIVAPPPADPFWEEAEALTVTEKRVFRLDADDCNDDGADCWTYERDITSPLPYPEQHPCTGNDPLKRTNPGKVVVRLPVQPLVTGAPNRNRDVYYFSGSCSRNSPATATPNGQLVRLEHQWSNGTIARSEKIEYDFEVDSSQSPPGGEKHINVRELRRTTTFNDAGGTYLVRENDEASWDGYGNYGITRERTNEGTTGGTEVVRRTDTAFCHPPEDRVEWFLGRYTSRKVYEGDGLALQQETRFDWDEFGRLWGKTEKGLNLVDPGAPYGDRSVHSHWTGHEKGCEVRCGGDSGQTCPPLVPAVEPCPGTGVPMRLPSCALGVTTCSSPPPFFATLQTYGNGAVVRRQHLGASWYSENLERSTSGAVLKSYDSMSQYYRQMTYDAASRLTQVDFMKNGASDEASLVLAYHAQNDRVNWSRVFDQGTLVAGQLDYDEYGRRSASLTPNPAGGNFTRYVKRDGLGNVIFRSDAFSASSTGENYVDWDPLGRPGRIRRNEEDQESFAYAGMTTYQTSYVNTGAGEEPVEVTRQHDGFGRLVKVIEPIPSGGNRRTTYTYDALDRLLLVDMGDANGTQLRTFTYDGLGNLRRAQEPESLTTDYLEYDAMGNAVRVRNSRGTVFARDYDCAGRLTRESTGSGDRVLEYDGTYPGRLVADRYVNLGGRTVRREFGHDGYFGRQNSLRTIISRPPDAPYEFTQAIAWNRLGLPGGIYYPQPFNERPPERPSATVIGQVFTAGLLTSILDGADALVSIPSYDPGGEPSQLDFLPAAGAPPISLTRDFDERNRVLRIRGTPGDFATGDYVYDRAGNVTAIGADRFAYDVLGQLRGATVHDLAGAPLTFGYGYDLFGNLHQRTGFDPVELAVDATTNRVTQQTSPPTTPWTYLPSGSVTWDGRNTYTWDGFERLAQAQVGSSTVDYTYDADGNRASVASEIGCQKGERFFLRDAQGQLRSEFMIAPGCDGQTVWVRDYLLAGSQLVGAIHNAALAETRVSIVAQMCGPMRPVEIAVATSAENLCRASAVEVFRRATSGQYDFGQPFQVLESSMVCPAQSVIPLGPTPADFCYVARARHFSGELGPTSNEVCDTAAPLVPCGQHPTVTCPTPTVPAAMQVRRYYFTDHLGTPRVTLSDLGKVGSQ